MDDRLVGRAVQYDGHAEAYARHAAASPYNAGIDRPAVLALLGEVRGLRVLDAGCGPGLYAHALVSRGALVTGFDQSHDIVTFARRRVATSQFRVHDLADPLTWIPDHSFDQGVLALTLHYVDNPVFALRELHRVLVPGGVLVVSLHHPVTDWLKHGGSYFDTVVVEEAWSAGWSVRYRRQPLEQTLAEFTAAGFAVDRLVEPRPTADPAARSPDHGRDISERPTFIAFRLRAQP